MTPPAADLEPAAPPADRTESTMDLDDTARVRAPRDAVEYRLGTVTDITHAPHSTHIQRLRLQFPTGVERTYTTGEVRACRRDDDRAALVAAVTDGCRALRDACRIAHDYDDKLGAEIAFLLASLFTLAQVRLGVTIDPAALHEPADGTGSARTDGSRS